MSWHLILYITSFLGIWFGSGLAISTVEKVSRRSKMSYFALSYLVLGFFTSSSEISVGANALIDNDPEIFVGNLIGASIVIFLLVMPLLAILGRVIHISDELKGNKSLPSLFVISLPVLLVLDGVLTRTDGIIAIVSYLLTTVFVQTRKVTIAEISKQKNQKGYVLIELLKIVLGLIIVFVSSKFVVEQTVYFSQILKISPFIISLLVISIGTNIPELSLVARSIFRRSNQVAFGDFVGSSSVNTFLLGLFAVIYGQDIVLANSYTISMLFLVIAVVMFYLFARSKNTISKLEGLAMFCLYIIFIYIEFSIYL